MRNPASGSLGKVGPATSAESFTILSARPLVSLPCLNSSPLSGARPQPPASLRAGPAPPLSQPSLGFRRLPHGVTPLPFPCPVPLPW